VVEGLSGVSLACVVFNISTSRRHPECPRRSLESSGALTVVLCCFCVAECFIMFVGYTMVSLIVPPFTLIVFSLIVRLLFRCLDLCSVCVIFHLLLLCARMPSDTFGCIYIHIYGLVSFSLGHGPSTSKCYARGMRSIPFHSPLRGLCAEGLLGAMLGEPCVDNVP
jgi:hypothetical protein